MSTIKILPYGERKLTSVLSLNKGTSIALQSPCASIHSGSAPRIICHFVTQVSENVWIMVFSSVHYGIRSDQIRSVAQSCPTLCDPMNRSMPDLPVHHQLPEFTETHVHRVSDAIQPSHPLSSPSLPAPNPSQHQSLFQWVNNFYCFIKDMLQWHWLFFSVSVLWPKAKPLSTVWSLAVC